MIDIQGLKVFYGNTLALRSIDVVLDQGITGLFGPNGSGKSTLLRVLAGLLRPSAGTVTLDGSAISARDEAFRRRVGYAGHDSGLYPRLTVTENLALFANMYGMQKSHVDDVIERLGLREWAGTQTGALSAGLKRRAAVARALLHRPEVLLLDEPYANVDDEAADLISSAVVAWRSPGRLGIVATHGAKKVKPYADAGLILKRGRVAVFGPYRKPASVEAR